MRAVPALAAAAAALLAPFATAAAGAPQRSPDPPAMLQAPAPAAKAPIALPHLDGALREIAAGWRERPRQTLEKARARGLTVRDGRIHVSLLLADRAAAERARDRIAGLDGEVTAHSGLLVDAWVPVGRVAELETIPGMSLAYPPVPPMPLPGPPTPAIAWTAGGHLTQGVAASNASAWHAAGLTGAGVSVAVIDQFRDVQAAVDLGELPNPTLCHPDCGSLDTSSRHGTACAEILHDMAPGAAITLSSATTATELAQRVGELAAAGVNVISVSLGFAAPVPGDGTGPMADAIAQARAQHGTLYVGAGGNHADSHWDGTWSDTDGDGRHEFPGGAEVNLLAGGAILPKGTPISAYLRWNDWPTSEQDFDLYLLFWDGSIWEIAGGSANFQTGTQPPWEFFSTVAPFTASYGLVIVEYEASTSPALDLMVWSRQSLAARTSSRSLVEPATSPASMTTAAVDATTLDLEGYSSRGPAHGPGGALSGGDSLPRLAAFANVDTWSYGSGVFNGTSAATPHVAGAAALVRSVFPESTPAQMQAFLEDRAIDQGAPGYDDAHGHGHLWLGAVPSWSLSVTTAGSGSGTVTSSPGGISCGGDCNQVYDHGTPVRLTATPASGSIFGGWSGDADCGDGLATTVTRDLACTATFYACSEAETTLASTSVTGTQTVTACERVHVGPSVAVTGTGDLTVVAGKSAVFYDGFAVATGGRLEVVVGSPGS